MQFKHISIRNFRVFLDEELRFSQNQEKNVTVLHGQNGSGKTTLLNAIRWALYGSVQFDQGSDSLPHQGEMARAHPGEKVSVSIDLSFEHEGSDFELHREALFEKQNEKDLTGEISSEDVSLVRQNGANQREKVNNPNTRIEQMMPHRLSNLFLFDGEYIDRISGADDRDEIKKAIQNIMGLEILERAIDHLKKVENRFENEVKQSGSDELQELVEKKQKKRKKKEDIERKITDIEESRSTLQSEIESIKAKYDQIDEVAGLSRERSNKEDQRSKLKTERDELTDDIKSEISTGGYLPFAMGAIEDTAKDIDELREKGKIPSELSNELVEELLQTEECICGRHLAQNSEAYQRVAAFKDQTPEGVDTAAIQLIARIGSIQEGRDGFFETVEKKVAERKEVNEKLEIVNEEIDELSNKIASASGYDPETDESPEELERSRDEKIAERAELKAEKEQLLQDKDETEDEIESLSDEIDSAREEEKEAALARKRMKTARLVHQDIKQSFQELQQRVRSWSNKRVQDTFSSVARKSNYAAHITEEFELEIREAIDDTEVEVQKSRGERQISSLAFIGSLVSIAKERHEDDSENRYFSGGIYPIVMDSPFGALDKSYRREIGRIIPVLANQVVVMVTDSQWEGPVENEMSDIVGKEYTLEYDAGSGESYARTRIEPVKEVPVRGD